MQENNLNLDDLHGKHLAMIATVYEEGESETAVFTGIAHWTGEHLLMLRGEDQEPFEVQSEWFERIRPVKEEIRSILRGAEFCFTVTMGTLPGDAGEEYQKTGLRWPGSTD